ncbi:hypothetical protein L210DRAFT_825099 [Boletus edulis BED1]|uniref:Uncharacterized protein n=1 Tax=Boletus edulis BED1 TaxID=1328754 RepID=A0AAD4BHS2_BOLED|nr:hypothetical protein L210DRAFT_825099 [Boletus edulis BED1]
MTRRLSKQIKGLSKSIAVHSHRGRTWTMTILQAGCQAKRMQEMTERRMAALEALPAEDQAAVDHMYAGQGVAVCYDKPMPFGSAESDKEDDDDGYDTEDEMSSLT